MSRFDVGPESEVQFTTFAVERMKVAAEGRIGSSVLGSVQLQQFMVEYLDQMAFRLKAEVLAERVLDTDTDVAFSGTRNVDSRVRVRGIWLPFGVAATLCLVALFVGSLALVLGSMAVALLGGVLLYLNPAETVTLKVPVDGTVTVPATYWRKFPEANVALPPSLGAPIRFATLSEPSYRAYEEHERDG